MTCPTDKLSFKIFADDTNVFASASSLKILEALMNFELEKVKERCDVNKLSINMSKKEKGYACKYSIRNSDGTSHPLVRKIILSILGE